MDSSDDNLSQLPAGNQCHDALPTRADLNRHFECHVDMDRPFPCWVCNIKFKTNSALQGHVKIVHDKIKPHCCPGCGKGFAKKSDVRRHMVIHSRTNPFECGECSTTFPSQRQLKSHVKEAHYKPQKSDQLTAKNEDSFQCDICKKLYSTSHHLTRHMRVHTGEKPYKCHICSAQFPRSEPLNDHLKLHHGTNECPICEKTFATEVNLKVHMTRHNGDKTHKCEICESKFLYKFELNKHMIVHSSKNKCQICRLQFVSWYALDRHMRPHTNEKPFECDTCHKWFRYSSQAKWHCFVRKKKEHQCVFCGKIFQYKPNFDDHIRWHIGEYSFQCQICPAAFTSYSNHWHHVKRVHGKKSSDE